MKVFPHTFRVTRPKRGGCGCSKLSCDRCWKPGWAFKIQIDGRQIKRSGFPSSEAAAKARAILEGKRAAADLAGVPVSMPEQKRSRHVRLHAWFDEYLDNHVSQDVIDSGWERALRSHLAKARQFFEANPELSALTLGDVEAYLLWLRKKSGGNIGPDSTRKYFGTFRLVLDTAVTCGKLAANPCPQDRSWKRHKVPKKPRALPRALTRKELAALVAACKRSILRKSHDACCRSGCVKCSEPHPFLWQIVVFAAATGARHGELLKLRWKDVQRDPARGQLHGTVKLSSKKGEGFVERSVPLTAAAIEALDALPHRGIGNAPVFCYRKGCKATSFTKAFNNACRRAGIGRVGFHALRHTFASLHVQAGTHLRVVQQYLGHSSIQLTERYSHFAPGATDECADNLDLGLGGA